MFSHNKKSVSPIFLQNLTLPAVAIKLYCFKLLFEHHFFLNNRPFVFSIIDNNFDSGCHSNKIWNEAKFLWQVLTACKVPNKSNRRLLKYCTFIFSLSCSIASVTSYLIENEAENLQNGDVHLTQIPDFETEYLERFFAFFTLFHLSLTFFFDRRFPLTLINDNFYRNRVGWTWLMVRNQIFCSKCLLLPFISFFNSEPGSDKLIVCMVTRASVMVKWWHFFNIVFIKPASYGGHKGDSIYIHQRVWRCPSICPLEW